MTNVTEEDVNYDEAINTKINKRLTNDFYKLETTTQNKKRDKFNNQNKSKDFRKIENSYPTNENLAGDYKEFKGIFILFQNKTDF